jgi:hypothetical protein
MLTDGDLPGTLQIAGTRTFASVTANALDARKFALEMELPVKVVAGRLQISVTQCRRLIWYELLPGTKLSTGWVVTESDLDAFFNRLVRSTSPSPMPSTSQTIQDLTRRRHFRFVATIKAIFDGRVKVWQAAPTSEGLSAFSVETTDVTQARRGADHHTIPGAAVLLGISTRMVKVLVQQGLLAAEVESTGRIRPGSITSEAIDDFRRRYAFSREIVAGGANRARDKIWYFASKGIQPVIGPQLGTGVSAVWDRKALEWLT